MTRGPPTTPPELTPGLVVVAGAGTGAAGAAGVGDPFAGLSLPDGLALTTSGAVTIGGLEWMGHRAYDPTTRGFLSTDPLPPIPGTSWAANPYAFAGNDPVHALDPTGLSPITDTQLQAYRDGNHGVFAAAGGAAGAALAHSVGTALNNIKSVLSTKTTHIATTALEDIHPTPQYFNDASEKRTQHVLDGELLKSGKWGGGHFWLGKPGKTPCPEDWSREKIMHHISDIATGPTLEWVAKKTR
ncbi:RHS repeat-associated core domain-containing protein [Rathayibacter toxicus]|uniref:RHS repeat-associated core domain-containing protein n=1 Tax=Rathayibacter toxicus TaxID=145458 RepID=UPI001C043F82|nr:RHS repeat-associated core domain-containing protein [Rathayibacter toxicus]QWL33227.1 hypothetical protein E2R35_10605 [Rathayibacter toxicus]QWL35322.1 hypothetical protein E2R36_10605 [Rathayibacter toxicus]QWL37453.1 hypothetical protein E2R37_10600 [Rathayibacter toxicus]QWL39546.1 hypothetical protein E2R38_10600 [Rathayibacter toxicus]QWL41629.1 hypothetical protein E2R39_10600 [Rathayibacter toxicus]